MLALLVKRVLYTRRKLVAYLIQTLLPLGLIILALFIAHQLQAVPDQPPLQFSPSLYRTRGSESYMFVGGCNDTQQWSFSPDFDLPSYLDYLNNLTNSSLPLSLPSTITNYTNLTFTPSPSDYAATLYSPCGVSAHYLDPDAQCNVTLDPSSFTCPGEPHLSYHCSCAECSDSAHFPAHSPACFSGTATGIRVQGVSRSCGEEGEGVEEVHKVLTSYLLRTNADYIEKRYGGVSFGHVRSEVNESVDAYNLQDSESWPFLAAHQAAKVWHTFKGYHALPSYLNTMSNSILRANLPEDVRQSSYGECAVSCMGHVTTV